jgi:hypothetical protein
LRRFTDEADDGEYTLLNFGKGGTLELFVT